MPSTEPAARTTLRVLHCSDIHLDSDRGSPLRYREGLEAVLAAGLTAGADLTLIAGDLFDTNDATEETIDYAKQLFAAHPHTIVMIPGNHDCLAANGIYRRHDFDAVPNVEMLIAPDGEQRVFPQLGVAVWGRGMVDHLPEYEPLADVPPRPDGVHWYLGLGHGIFVPDGEHTGRSSPVHEQHIASSPFDYVALGHHHAAMEVHAGGTAAAFSGSPTDSIGRGATYALVDLHVSADVAVEILCL